MVFILIILIIWCRYSPTAADWYATHLYPGISRILSWIASPVGISLTELAVVVLVIAFIVRVYWIFHDRVRWKYRLWRAVRLLLWVYVWFYAAWGVNYFRSNLFARMGTTPMPYEEAEFREFLHVLTEELNENWCPETVLESVDEKEYEQYVKDWYSGIPEESGLCTPRKWQHPKRSFFNRFYSAVGVLGYLGPAFDEMHVNREITPLEHPFVHAHEYAHVLGVSREAEANFWAFEATRASDSQAVRYSGWYMLLHYSWNTIYSLLGEEEFAQWRDTLRPEILEDMLSTHQYWMDRRIPWVSKIQKRIYDAFLRGNHIAEGTKNYNQVLRLVLTFSDLYPHEDGEEG